MPEDLRTTREKLGSGEGRKELKMYSSAHSPAPPTHTPDCPATRPAHRTVRRTDDRDSVRPSPNRPATNPALSPNRPAHSPAPPDLPPNPPAYAWNLGLMPWNIPLPTPSSWLAYIYAPTSYL